VKYRRTKDGSLEVSEVGLGTYAVSGVYGARDRGEFERVVARAVDLGITFFDTAPTYGDAEQLLGRVLGPARDRVAVSSKVAAGLEEGFSCSFDKVVASCEQSLRNLATDRIDLYQIHFDDGHTPAEEVVRAMEHLKASGKIRCYGIGHVSYERAEEYLACGHVATVMGELSAAAPKYHRKMLPLVRRYGAGYVGFSLTGRSVLAGEVTGRAGFDPEDLRRMDALFEGERLESALRVRDKFVELGRRVGATPAQMAVRWALSQEGVVTGLVGPSTIAHLEDDAGASDLEIAPDTELALNACVAAEEERLREALRAEIIAILNRPITALEQVPQLVYALEGSADLELAPEEDLIGHFKRVIPVMQGAAEPSSLEEVRESLRRQIGAR
jgi:aryl-alcohol dehydrogenase-like predicted oxidoreductase